MRRLFWQIRHLTSRVDHAGVTLVLLALTLLALIGIERRLATPAESTQQVTEPATRRMPDTATQLPDAAQWLNTLASLRKHAARTGLQVSSGNHTWQAVNENALSVTSSWRWRGSWSAGAHTLVGWLNDTPNLALTQFRVTVEPESSSMEFTLETTALFRRAGMSP